MVGKSSVYKSEKPIVTIGSAGGVFPFANILDQICFVSSHNVLALAYVLNEMRVP